MNINLIRTAACLVPVLVMMAAAPRASTDDLVRRGNEAFAAKDYAAAVKLYQEAEVLTPDPGLVAYNKAAALYQLGLAAKTPSEAIVYFRGAEEHYRCASEDVAEPRRLLAKFGLANSLLQGRSGDIAAIRRAVACYRELVQSTALDETLTGDARHNLEVAKLHLLKLQAKEEAKPPQDQGGDEKKPPRDDSKEPKNTDDRGDPMQGMGKPKPTDDPASASKDGKKPIPTDQHAEGGRMKPMSDDTPAPPLSVAEAEEELELAVQRILLEQRGKRYRSSRFPPGGVKDW